MKLSKIAILALRGLGKDIKDKISETAGVHPATVYTWIQDNKVNGDLTKAAIVQLISEETGLPSEQLLEDETTEGVNIVAA